MIKYAKKTVLKKILKKILFSMLTSHIYINLLVGTHDLQTLWSPSISLNRIYFEETFCFKQPHALQTQFTPPRCPPLWVSRWAKSRDVADDGLLPVALCVDVHIESKWYLCSGSEFDEHNWSQAGHKVKKLECSQQKGSQVLV
jgi:hypothetical protein